MPPFGIIMDIDKLTKPSKPLEQYQQAYFLMYLMHEGLPPWCESAADAFARLFNISLEEADEAFQEAVDKGFLGRQ